MINAVGGFVGLHPNLKTSFAAGGRIPGYAPNSDTQMAAVSPGEYILTPEASAGIGYANLDAINQSYSGRTPARYSSGGAVPSFASGGVLGWFKDLGSDALGMVEGLFSKAGDVAKILTALATGNATAATNAFEALLPKGVGGALGELADVLMDLPPKLVAGAVSKLMSFVESFAKDHLGSGVAIAQFAKSFLGKIPYVWGGTTLGAAGADCSGFTQAVYGHFGIEAPRTSEAQGAWVKRDAGASAPAPGRAGALGVQAGGSGVSVGGLAFYHSPPGGPDPGHVAIVYDDQTVVSQGGGMGPQMMPINAMPLLFTGTPPGGFANAVAGGTTPGQLTPGQISSMWVGEGGNSGAAVNMASIAFLESGDIPSTVQKGEPPGLTGWGLYQITPTSGITQNGQFGDLLDAANNTRAAIALYNARGYAPWSADAVGGRLSGSGLRAFAAGGKVPLYPDWIGSTNALQAAIQSESTSLSALEASKLPATPAEMRKPARGSTAAERNAYHARERAIAASPTNRDRSLYSAWLRALASQQTKTIGISSHPPGAFGRLRDEFGTPNKLDTAEWNAFGSSLSYLTDMEAGPGIKGGFNPRGTSGYPAWHWLNPKWTALRNSLLGVGKDYKETATTWSNLYGPHALPKDPGPAHVGKTIGRPETYSAADIMNLLDPQRVVARPSFSAGGLMSGFDTLASSLTAPDRKLSAAAKSVSGAPVIQGDITINNPLPETAGDSLTRSVNKLAMLAGR